MRTVTQALYIYPNGREICRKDTREGRLLYRNRTLRMRERQKGRCCLEFYAPMCPGRLRTEEATFEHENGRTAGKQDDRIVLPDGKLINGAAHVACNQWKGSRKVRYNR